MAEIFAVIVFGLGIFLLIVILSAIVGWAVSSIHGMIHTPAYNDGYDFSRRQWERAAIEKGFGYRGDGGDFTWNTKKEVAKQFIQAAQDK